MYSIDIDTNGSSNFFCWWNHDLIFNCIAIVNNTTFLRKEDKIIAGISDKYSIEKRFHEDEGQMKNVSKKTHDPHMQTLLNNAISWEK